MVNPIRNHSRLRQFIRVACECSLLTCTVFSTCLAAEVADSRQSIVIGQSLPLTGPAYRIATSVQAGAQALVNQVNANGGVNGRKLELVTLDDAGDPKRVAANVRTLAQDRRLLAIVNCLGERACGEAAAVAQAARVVLVGPFSGAAALRAGGMPHVFTVRPDDRREAAVLTRQLQSINISRVALLVDGYEPAREAVVAEMLHAGGIDAKRIPLDPNRASIERALHEVSASGAQGVVLNLGPDSIESLDQTSALSRAALPSMVVSVGSVGVTQLARTMGERTLGYTAVVPNPEVSQLPLVREFERAADSVGAEAITFEGLASYLHMRIVVEALSRLGGRLEPGRMAAAIESLNSFDIGGFRLRFGPQRHQGSDHVELGVRTREGKLRR